MYLGVAKYAKKLAKTQKRQLKNISFTTSEVKLVKNLSERPLLHYSKRNIKVRLRCKVQE